MTSSRNIRHLTRPEVDAANIFAGKRRWTVEPVSEDDGDCLHFCDRDGEGQGSIGTQDGFLHTIGAAPDMAVYVVTDRIEKALAAL